jgi:hypothetical protein
MPDLGTPPPDHVSSWSGGASQKPATAAQKRLTHDAGMPRVDLLSVFMTLKPS